MSDTMSSMCLVLSSIIASVSEVVVWLAYHLTSHTWVEALACGNYWQETAWCSLRVLHECATKPAERDEAVCDPAAR